MNTCKMMLVGLALLPCACTTELKATRVVDGAAVPVAGAPYNLPYTRFRIHVVRRVVSCWHERTPEQARLTGERYDRSVKVINVQVQATAVPEQARDPLRSYVIDLVSLQSFFKTTDLQVSYYDSGMLKAVNGSAEDMTGEFLASAAGAAAKVFAGAAGFKTSSGEKGGAPLPATCTEKVAAAVAALERLEPVLAESSARIAAQAAELQQLVDLAVATGRNYPAVDRAELTRRMRELIGLQRDHAATQAEIERHLALTAVTDDVTWPADGETFVSPTPVVAAIGADVVRRWTGKSNADFVDDTAVYFALSASEKIGRAMPCGSKCTDDEAAGLKYRMPALGVLSMCAALTPAQPDKLPRCDDATAVTPAGMISQLGPIYTLPLHSTLFSKKSVTASFSEHGMPTEIGTRSTAAAGKAATTFASLADAAALVKTSRAGREAADLQSRIDVLKLRKELQVATDALSPAPPDPRQETADAFTLDTAMLNAELANLKARAALADARRSVPAP